MSQSASTGNCGNAPMSLGSGAVNAADFKARCLQIIDHVKETGVEVTITKHGHPVAKVVPVAAQVTRPPLLGSCKGSLIILDDDDLVPSTANEWTDWEARVERRPGIPACCCWTRAPCCESCRTTHGSVPKPGT